MFGLVEFLPSGQDLSVAYYARYDVLLVSLSVFAAILGSSAAFLTIDRITRAETRFRKLLWLVPGATSLGGGVWTMHFIGMLALSLPCGISYDPFLTTLSIVPGALAGALALWIVANTETSARVLMLGGALMGAGIGLMHYTGMAAMRLDAILYYSPGMFALSVVFAVALSTLSMYAKFVLFRRVRGLPNWSLSILAGSVMGLAISGMHYLGMEAAHFLPAGNSGDSVPGYPPTLLAAGVGSITALLSALAFAVAFLAKHRDTIDLLKAEVSARKQLMSDLEFQKFALDEHAIVSITDMRGTITYANDKFCDISGYDRGELIGQTHSMLSSGIHSPEFYNELWQTVTNGKTWHGELMNVKKSGEGYWIKTSIVPFVDEKGKPFKYVGIHTDITEQKQIGLLKSLAYRDALTGLPNRRLLEDRLEIAVAQAKRSDASIALLFVDLDHFKPINDNFGHDAGDAVLRTVADRLTEAVRDTDTVARVGGDEFAIIMAAPVTQETSRQVGERIIEAVCRPIVVKNHDCSVGASVGISIYPRDTGVDSANRLVELADAAMYKVKQGSRNGISFFGDGPFHHLSAEAEPDSAEACPPDAAGAARDRCNGSAEAAL